MNLLLFAKLACSVAVVGALACAATLFASINGIALHQWIFFILFTSAILSFFPVIYIHRKLLSDDGDLFGSGIYGLLRNAPIWLITIDIACLVLTLIAWLRWSDVASAAAFFLLFHTSSATLMYLVYRNPHLVWGSVCPNGHSTKHYNRFCPTCGALLSKRKSA